MWNFRDSFFLLKPSFVFSKFPTFLNRILTRFYVVWKMQNAPHSTKVWWETLDLAAFYQDRKKSWYLEEIFGITFAFKNFVIFCKKFHNVSSLLEMSPVFDCAKSTALMHFVVLNGIYKWHIANRGARKNGRRGRVLSNNKILIMGEGGRWGGWGRVGVLVKWLGEGW